MLYDYLPSGEGPRCRFRWMVYGSGRRPVVIVLRNLTSASDGPDRFNVNDVRHRHETTGHSSMFDAYQALFLAHQTEPDYDAPMPTLIRLRRRLSATLPYEAFWFYKKKGWPYPWFYIGLSPVQSFVPIIDVIFEHRAYMPSIGIFLAFVAAYEGLFEWWGARKLKGSVE
jgi:hypothetical protein